jgi:hypothetical protein
VGIIGAVELPDVGTGASQQELGADGAWRSRSGATLVKMLGSAGRRVRAGEREGDGSREQNRSHSVEPIFLFGETAP